MKLWNRDFIMVLVGQIISLFGNAVLRFALPLYLLNQTGSAALFGAVAACSFIPMILLAPVGGIFADRVNKKNIMVALDFSTAAITAVFTLLLGQMNLVVLMLITMVLLYGIQGAYQPAVQASIPVLVPAESIVQGNAMVNSVSSLSNLVGPVIGGAIYGFIGIMPVLYISIICFLASAVMEIFIHIPFERKEMRGSMLQAGISDIKESFAFIKNEQPGIFQVGIIIAAVNLIISSCAMIGLPVIITQKMGFDADMANVMYGYVEGALGAGSLAGGVLAGMLGSRLKVGHCGLLLFLCGTTMLAFAAAMAFPMGQTAAYVITLIASFIMMATAALFSIRMMAYLQILTPVDILGKVISCVMCLCMCATPVGQLVYGALFEQFANHVEFIFSGAFVGAVLITVFSAKVFSGLEKYLCEPETVCV